MVKIASRNGRFFYVSVDDPDLRELMRLLAIGSLKHHEEIRPEHVKELFAEITNDGMVKQPIIVDQKTMIVLDGHHRTTALKNMGITKIPAFLVDYQSEEIMVAAWRRGERVTKEMVIEAALSGKLLPPKTSRHILSKQTMEVNVPLSKLK